MYECMSSIYDRSDIHDTLRPGLLIKTARVSLWLSNRGVQHHWHLEFLLWLDFVSPEIFTLMLGTAFFWRSATQNLTKSSNPMRCAPPYFLRWDNDCLRDTNSSKTRDTKIVLSSPLPGISQSDILVSEKETLFVHSGEVADRKRKRLQRIETHIFPCPVFQTACSVANRCSYNIATRTACHRTHKHIGSFADPHSYF